MADDIEKVRSAEQRRGRRPKDTETIAERRRIEAELREICDYGTEDELKAAMRRYGLSPDSPEWLETLRIWSDERERR